MLNTTIAHYKITAKIGAGGMGEVYRARDTKLDRDVAVKMLPESVSADPDRVARFEREAKVLASFSHPGIAGIFGVEEKDGNRFLILEMVEGEDLALRLSRGPLIIEDALDIARQVADALEAAHDQGIIHRDLKPANIVVTPEGVVKVLDFGLAKALDVSTGGDSGADLSNSPTIMTQSPTMNSPTMAGVILGTAAYMSPEQARGKPVDRRADIWAFGCVLYEMLTGTVLFSGDTVSDTLAAVLRAEPDYSKLPKDTPPAVRALLARTLNRDKRRRMQAMGEARIALEDVAQGKTGAPAMAGATDGASGDAPPKKKGRGGAFRWGVLITVAIVILAFVSEVFEVDDPLTPTTKVVSHILAPAGVQFESTTQSVALSPDGNTLAFTAEDADGNILLYVRDLGDATARALPGTTDATALFWSPDGDRIGFMANATIHTVDLDGGQPQVVVERRGNAVWGPDGYIYFVDDTGTGDISRVRASGGTLQLWADPFPGVNNNFNSPQWLPDGRGLLFQSGDIAGDIDGVYVIDAESKELKRLLTVQTNAVYADGRLLYMNDDNLMAAPFDVGELEMTGDAELIASPVHSRNYPFYGFYTAAAGNLVYMPGITGAGVTEYVWVDRAGEEIAHTGISDDLYSPHLSPDGRRVATDLSDAPATHGDIWVFDLVRGSSVRLTDHPSDESRPVWHPDGRHVYYFRLGDIYKQRVASDAEPELILDEERFLVIQDVSADGRYLLIDAGDSQKGTTTLLLFDVESGEARDWLGGLTVSQAQLSPDGRWVAYNSVEAGNFEVFVESFPERSERFQVSSASGGQARWRGDGRELYYFSATGQMMAVPIDMSSASDPIGEPVILFEANLRRDDYDVTDDGERFLLNRRLDRAPVHSLVLMQNWADGLTGAGE